MKNHLRDVVYQADLLQAVGRSLDFQNYRLTSENIEENEDFVEQERLAPISNESRRQTLASYLRLLWELFPPLRDPELDGRLRTYLSVSEQFVNG